MEAKYPMTAGSDTTHLPSTAAPRSTLGIELVAEDLSFPTSLVFDAVGTAYVAESGLPFGAAAPGGWIWRL